MNTMTNTADFSIDTTAAAGSDFFARLLKVMLGLLSMAGGANCVEAGLLAERIVLE